MTFLSRVAATVFERHGTQMDDVWVILPTRRAVSYFQQHLSQFADKPFLAPHTLAVDDFITHSSGVELIDSVSLLFELYEVFREIDQTLDFNRYMNWAGILLADFDRIDQYLISSSELFNYLTAAKAIERWRLELPSDKVATLVTDGTQRYFKLFENLQTAYTALRERLSAKGLAYRGMAYRRLSENVEEWVRDNPAFEKIYFVGFNALSRSEEQIVKALVKGRKAEMFWDTDSYYMQHHGQEAGKLLRQYKRDGWSGPWTWEEKNLTETAKHIQIIGLPNASMQAKVAGQLYENWRAADGEGRQPTTALVLGDETLLLPVLYSLGGNGADMNVTMGLSLRNSLLFTLVDALFEMQRTVAVFRKKDGSGSVAIPKFNYRNVVKVLSHPFIRQYEQVCLPPPEENAPSLLQDVLQQITIRNYVYLDEKELLTLGQDTDLFRVLFQRWPDDKPLVIIHRFYQLIDMLRDVYSRQGDAIETEYLHLFHSLLTQLEATLEREERKELVDVKSLRQFLYELIRQTSIPFESEGTGSLQVMGMLETRALDFDRLIILSVNEGTLPQSRKLNSLIPFDACMEVGLPTYQDQESVMAYHFYRLLQRTKEVAVLYVTSPDAYGTGKGEKSRFILQLEHELQPAARGNITISYPVVRFGQPAEAPKPIVTNDTLQIIKTAPIVEKLKYQLSERMGPSGQKTGGLYPTQLNNFLSCSLRYYFGKVIHLKEDEEVDERMGADEFGDWIHRTLETLDQEYRMQGVSVDAALVKKVLEEQYRKLFQNRVIESGMNLLLYRIAEDLVVRFNTRQIEKYEGRLEVLQTETEYDTIVQVASDTGPVSVRIAGKIDRVERLHQPDGSFLIRVADYKTGKVEARDAEVRTAEALLSETRYEKARQLWLYQYLIYKQMLKEGGLQFGKEWLPGTDIPVVAGFYSFRNLKDDFIENKLYLGGPQEYVDQTEAHLRHLISRLLDPTQPFRKTDDKKVCEWCSYRKLCGR